MCLPLSNENITWASFIPPDILLLNLRKIFLFDAPSAYRCTRKPLSSLLSEHFDQKLFPLPFESVFCDFRAGKR